MDERGRTVRFKLYHWKDNMGQIVLSFMNF